MEFQLDQAIGMHVNRTAFLMAEEIARRFAEHGYPLTAQDFGILYRLSKQGTMTQVEIATSMLRDKTTITRRIDGLVKKHLVKRNPHPGDRRYYHISVTREGKHALSVLIPLVSAFQQEVLSGISETDQQITLNTLRHISGRLIASRSKRQTP